MAQKKPIEHEEDAKAAPAKQPKERRFVDARTGKNVVKPQQGGSGAAAKAAREEMHEERAGAALPFRIGAIVLWVLGIVAETLAILAANGTLYLPKLPSMTWVIVFLVVDLALVVTGSQLWKHANHVSPASKENKVAYWAQTDLGTIIAVIAFAPVILLMLTNKDLDAKTKKICSAVAGVALVVAVASGIDYHPTTQEDVDQAEAGAAVLSDDGLAYWTPFGEVYHFNPDCQYIKNSGTIYSGSIGDALEAGRSRACSGCAVEDGTDTLDGADPAAVAAAAADAVSVIEGGNAGSGTANDDAESEADAEAGQLPQAA